MRSYSENGNKKFQIQGGGNVPRSPPVSAPGLAIPLNYLELYNSNWDKSSKMPALQFKLEASSYLYVGDWGAFTVIFPDGS